MKKFLMAIALCLMCATTFTSCTEQERAKQYGGSTTINLPKGQKLIEATWKEDDLWYLTEPMEDDYVPTTKTFQESSDFGVWEGTVTFVESK